jgi:ribonuclease R
LDDEAYKRATSVYLVDRVVPMLPEVLSNFACSLRPNEEKYTFSAVFELNEKAQLMNQWFGRTVIHSNQRFSYEEAQYIIESNTKNLNSDKKELLLDDTTKNNISSSKTKGNTIPEEISITGKAYQVPDDIVAATLKMDELAKILT